ncbi:MAG TPA: ribosomal RNA small subunit methyltransferase A [Deltaproteobacteria bacterium]|nr:ribosomal RNA small subunit methyltransferase A [Deltaproteobacteria bacterium]
MGAKRSLGQNFLQNSGIVEKIIAFAEIRPDECVLEIGPGKGILTHALARQSAHLTAIEKDDLLFERLDGIFKESDHVTVVHGDILECDLDDFIRPGIKIVANLPYNIASRLIIRLTDYARQITSAVFMVQKEVARRICAHAGQSDYSALSVLVSTAFTPIPGFVVGPNNFIPKPKVDSQLIKLISKGTTLNKEDARILKKVVFTAFNQRRKMLKNSLLALEGIDKDSFHEFARNADIDPSMRPQDLTPEDYLRLSLFCKR